MHVGEQKGQPFAAPRLSEIRSGVHAAPRGSKRLCEIVCAQPCDRWWRRRDADQRLAVSLVQDVLELVQIELKPGGLDQ